MNLLRSILLAGAISDKELVSEERAKVRNSFSILSFLLATPFVFFFFSIGLNHIAFTFVMTQIVLAIGIWFNYRGKLYYSKLIIIVIYNVILPVFSAQIGFNSGFYIYYFLAPILLFSLFKMSDTKYLYFGLFTALLSLSITLIMGHLKIIVPPKIILEYTQYIFCINVSFGLVIISILTIQLLTYHSSLTKTVNERNRDLNQHKLSLEKTLREKEILLAEVHHRVKNNMAIMSGLVNLQLKNVQSEETKEVLMNHGNRIRSMSLIHNDLYKRKDIESIDFKSYATRLISEIKNSFDGSRENIELILKLDQITLPIQLAIPCGIILNEVIVNAFKHAFQEHQNGTLKVTIKNEKNTIEITVKDNGKGFTFTPSEDSLGMSLIESLTDQLDGSFHFDSKEGEGTRFKLTFGI